MRNEGNYCQPLRAIGISEFYADLDSDRYLLGRDLAGKIKLWAIHLQGGAIFAHLNAYISHIVRREFWACSLFDNKVETRREFSSSRRE